MPSTLCPALALLLLGAAPETPRARQLAEWPWTVALDQSSTEPPTGMLARSLRQRRQAVNAADLAAWRSLHSRDAWEAWREPRLAALRRACGSFPAPPADLHVQVVQSHTGPGFRVDCLVFESRPGLLVTANLYRPDPPRPSQPGLVLCHSHHRPKTEGELQEMGITWARAGCLVIVPDLLGHGERRQHPYISATDWPTAFRVERQDYYFRYNLGIQLHLIGDSLLGWFVWDLSRCVDLLLKQPGIDPQRIALLGSVAGGGDPAAVTMALDSRIAAAVPFNFGGPQPETEYPLPADADASFNYVGGGSWESTRNLTRSAADGFLPWVIVGSAAPRSLVYAHEFSWDRDRDPVWRRLETLYGWYEVPDRLAATLGWGKVTQASSEASHCNNIGRPHRRAIHQAFERWLRISPPALEEDQRFKAPQLACLDGVAASNDRRPTPVHQLARDLATQRGSEFRKSLADLPEAERRRRLRVAWQEKLGVPLPTAAPSFHSVPAPSGQPRSLQGWLRDTHGIDVPVLLLLPEETPAQGSPVVIILSQAGQLGLLRQRAGEIADLLDRGAAVCLPDLRGTGATQPDAGRGRRSTSTSLSSAELMLGGTQLGGQLRDLLHVVAWLGSRPEVCRDRLAVWGESLVAPNGPEDRVAMPHDAGPEVRIGEPGAGLLALLAAAFDERIAVVLSRGSLLSFASLLDSPFVHVPHDIVVPGVLTVGDLPDLAALCGPKALRIESPIDSTNRAVPTPEASTQWKVAVAAYAQRQPPQQLLLGASRESLTSWLYGNLTPGNGELNTGAKPQP
ncbi:MAG: hypothetical protein U0935_14080 [Pirellulales bacterium]